MYEKVVSKPIANSLSLSLNMSSIWRSPSHHMVSGASVTLTKLLWGRVHEKLLVENELKYVQIYNQYLYYQVWEYQEAVCFYWLI